MKVYLTTPATNKLDSISNSTAVNINDYLQTIYFYNAKNLGNNVNYSVVITDNQGNQLSQYNQALYDSLTQRVIFNADQPIDMTRIQQILFTPVK